MLQIRRDRASPIVAAAMLLAGTCGAARAAVHLEGQAQAGGNPLANAAVTLWAGSSGDPRQLAQARSGADGSFRLDTEENVGPDSVLYLTAQGDANRAVVWLSVLGNTPPAKAVVNEMTTV